MTIVHRPSSLSSSASAEPLEPASTACRHGPARQIRPWAGEPGTAGRVAVIGAGQTGLTLAAQYASHGWSVVVVDLQQPLVEAINAGDSHPGEEPGLAQLIREAHTSGRLRATTDGGSIAAEVDVIVLAVPVALDDEEQPDYRHVDAAIAAIGPGVTAGSTVIFETATPVGDTRGRFVPRLEAASGLRAETDLLVAFSPERLYSGAALQSLATYPKLVGGIGPRSGERAAQFYASVIDADVVLMSSAEAAELSKLADTTYRDVNIALANQFARYADRIGLDVEEVIAAANSQPNSHIHQPGLGVGGRSIPVYPHFLLARAPEMELVEMSRRVNDGQVGLAIKAIQKELGGLEDVPVLVLGLTYREGVKELAYSRALPLIERLSFHGAQVAAYDPLLSAEEVERCCATAYRWGEDGPFRAIVTQTADPTFRGLDFSGFPSLTVLYDGRNSLRDVPLPAGVIYRGVGIPSRAL
jgi:nucleotide sugar dehydrogenase